MDITTSSFAPKTCLMVFLITACQQLSADSAKILGFFPMPTKSHQRFMQPLMKELSTRGHAVTMYTPYLALQDYPSNMEIVKLPDYMPIMKQSMGTGASKSSSVFNGEDGFRTLMNIIWYRKFGNDLARWMFGQEEVQQLISSESQFDVVFLATSYFQEPYVTLGHRFNASVITFLPSNNWLWAHYLHGNPYDTSYIVECMHDLSDHMNFQERLYLTTANMLLRLVYSLFFDPASQEILDRQVRYPGWESRPSLREMLSRVSLVLTNSDIATNYPYPYAPHFVQVGGLNLQPPKPLPKHIMDFMEGAKDGVIYFSLGSFVDVSSVLGEETGGSIAEMMGTLKQRILWKWEKDLKGLPSNVKIGKWFPQQDILRHKNMAVFITHGGLLSLTEALDSGVPTIGIPLASDQMKNVRHMEHFGYGLRLQINNLTADSLSWALNHILNDPKYSENAKKRSRLFRDKPETALETAVYWTEYVIRHKGANHLRPAVAMMSWYQQAMIDVYATIAIFLFMIIYLMYRLLKILIRLCGSNNRKD